MAGANGILPTISQNLNVPIVSPVGSLVDVGTSSILVIDVNPSRHGIIFSNPTGVNIWVCPSNVVTVSGRGVLIPPGGLPISFLGDPSQGITFNCGWNAIAASGSGNYLTILELL